MQTLKISTNSSNSEKKASKKSIFYNESYMFYSVSAKQRRMANVTQALGNSLDSLVSWLWESWTSLQVRWWWPLPENSTLTSSVLWWWQGHLCGTGSPRWVPVNDLSFDRSLQSVKPQVSSTHLWDFLSFESSTSLLFIFLLAILVSIAALHSLDQWTKSIGGQVVLSAYGSILNQGVTGTVLQILSMRVMFFTLLLLGIVLVREAHKNYLSMCL